MQENNREIPVFFAVDDNYIPFFDVALRSMIANASPLYKYSVIVLNSGLKEENEEKIKRLETEGVQIRFVDIAKRIEKIKDKLKKVYHFGLACYYRLFIEGLFPEYDKALYLDCDIVVLGDISELYRTDLQGNLLGGAVEEFVAHVDEFRTYAKQAVGIEPERYINSGILLMNLKGLREAKIQDRFIRLLEEYNFDTVDPDQAYLNFLCKDRIHYLKNGWNKTAYPVPLDGALNIVHYALVKKPWQYDDAVNGEYFWQYAKESPFFGEILARKASFGAEDDEKCKQAGESIRRQALAIAASEKTFYRVLAA